MYCRQCGSANDDNAWKCVKCGETLQQAPSASSPPTEQVSSHLAWAIVVTVLGTLCCCLPLPFGIPAIVYASQVNGKVAAGDLVGAREASRKAKLWSWVTFWVWLALFVLYALFWITVILRASAS
jgi:hypothetical protein